MLSLSSLSHRTFFYLPYEKMGHLRDTLRLGYIVRRVEENVASEKFRQDEISRDIRVTHEQRYFLSLHPLR